jgi:hypothetical protein
MEVLRVSGIEWNVNPRFDRDHITLYQSIYQYRFHRSRCEFTSNYDLRWGSRVDHFLDDGLGNGGTELSAWMYRLTYEFPLDISHAELKSNLPQFLI